MRPRLMAAVENEREEQRVHRRQLLKDKRTTKLVKLHDGLRGTSTFPGWRQITGLPSITSLLKVIDEGKEVTREAFMTASPNILAEIEQLKQQVRHDLVELLMDAGALSPIAGSKAKGKERAVQKTWTDSEAQTLLDTPVALFICHPLSPKKVTDCRQIYSYQGLLEHWHNCHSYSRWDVSFICAAWDEQQLEKLARLLAALELPLNTTMAAIETRVRSGRAKCSCGYDCTREAGRSRPHLMLSRIVSGPRIEADVR